MKENLQRYVREMKNVFKELQVLVEKGKVALHKLTKIYWKQYLQVQARLVTRFFVIISRIVT